MADKTHLVLATSLMTLLASQAFADITPEQVWEDFQSKADNSGFEISVADTNRDDSSLTVKEIVARKGNELSNITFFLGDLKFHDLGDGRVQVELPDEMRGTVWRSTLQNKTDADVKLTYEALKIIASGNPDEISYKYSSDSAQISLHGKSTGNVEASLLGSFETSGLQGVLHAATSDTDAIFVSDMHSDKTSAGFMIKDTTFDETSSYSGQIAFDNLHLGHMFYMNENMIENMYNDSFDQLQDLQDLNFKEDMSYNGLSWAFDIDTGPKISAEGTSGPAQSKVSINIGGISAQHRSEDIHVSVLADPSIMPSAEVYVDEISYDSAFPFPPVNDEAARVEDAKLNLLVSGLRFNEDLWSVVDPFGGFDRSPMSLQVNADATIDTSLGDNAPFMPKAAHLSKLAFKGLGVDLSATGHLFVDYATNPAAGVMPFPEGELDIQVSGMDALLNTLAITGLVPEDDVTFYSLILGGYTSLQDDGSRRAKITYSDDGTVILNGNRIQ